MSERSAKQIRSDVERTRGELADSMTALRTKVGALTDVRRQVTEHRTELITAGAVAGTLLGGWAALKRR